MYKFFIDRGTSIVVIENGLKISNLFLNLKIFNPWYPRIMPNKKKKAANHMYTSRKTEKTMPGESFTSIVDLDALLVDTTLTAKQIRMQIMKTD